MTAESQDSEIAIEEIEVAPAWIASVRRTAPPAEVARAAAEGLGVVRAWLAAAGAGAGLRPGREVVVYHPAAGEVVELECGVEIDAPVERALAPIRFARMPAGRALCARQREATDAAVARALAALGQACRDRGLMAAVRWEIRSVGGSVEVYASIEPNAAQVAYWNGPGGDRWAELWPLIDGAMGAITAEILEVAAPRPGERVLDVGCGAGTTALALREGVGAGGAVTGVDISAPMLAVARERAAAAGAGTAVSFVEADAAAHPFESAHDLVFSRFGVMFFSDPVAAFANLRRAAAPGGRLAFVCWRAAEDNAWVTVPLGAARSVLPDMPAPIEGVPGPFAFVDRDRVRGILESAGWREIAIERRDPAMALGATLEQAARYVMMIGPVARGLAEVGEAVRDQVRARVAEALAPFAAPAGVAVASSCWMVTARA